MNPRGSPGRRLGVLVCFALCAAGAAGALDVEIAYRTRSDSQQGFFPYGHQSAPLSYDPPKGEWKLPDTLTGKPLYGAIEFGDRTHLMVLDRENESDDFYTRLRFDGNGNRDVTDDPVHTAQSRQSDRNRFLNVERIAATVMLQGKELPYLFGVQFHAYNQNADSELDLRYVNFYISSHSAYRGTFTLDGAAYDVWLGDGNANGRFDDVFKPLPNRTEGPIYGMADSLFLARANEEVGYSHSQSLGRHLVIGKHVFESEIDIPGGVMRLTPVDGPHATLSFPAELVSLQVYQPDTNAVVTILPEGKSAPVPPGAYRLLRYRLQGEDAGDALWEVVSAGSVDGPLVQAVAGAPGKIPLGEPFAPKVTVQYYGVRNNKPQARLEFRVNGSGNEIVSDLRVVNGKSKVKLSSSDSNRPAEPTYRIVNTEGEVVASGRFEYG